MKITGKAQGLYSNSNPFFQYIAKKKSLEAVVRMIKKELVSALLVP